MEKFRQTVRLYTSTDSDLLKIIENYDIDIAMAMYQALKAFSSNNYFIIELTNKRKQTCIDKSKRYYLRHIFFDPRKDKKAIQVLKKIKPGGRNNFLKNLLRMYLCKPLLEEDLEDANDILEFELMFDKMKGIHKRVKAEDMHLVRSYDWDDYENESYEQENVKKEVQQLDEVEEENGEDDKSLASAFFSLTRKD